MLPEIGSYSTLFPQPSFFFFFNLMAVDQKKKYSTEERDE
jgi:hypothetical protein